MELLHPVIIAGGSVIGAVIAAVITRGRREG